MLDLVLQLQQLLGHVIGLEVLQIVLGVVPVLAGLADDAALAVALAATVELFIKNESAHDGAGKAGGVADLGPAHRLVMHAEGVQMLFRLEGILPQELGVELALGDVDVDADRRDAHDAFQRVQLGADHQHLFVGQVRHQLARQLGIALPGGIAHAREQAACTLDAQGVDQLLAQRAEGTGVQQQHAVLVEGDRAIVELQLQRGGQLANAADIELAGHARLLGLLCAAARVLADCVTGSGRCGRVLGAGVAACCFRRMRSPRWSKSSVLMIW